MTLDQLIADTAKRGELSYLSLIPTRKGWSATYARASNCSHSIATHADPVEAIRLALTAKKPREVDFG